MKFNIIDLLLPRETKFYDFLKEQADIPEVVVTAKYTDSGVMLFLPVRLPYVELAAMVPYYFVE